MIYLHGLIRVGKVLSTIIMFLRKILFNNHATDVTKCKIKGHLPLQYLIGLCKSFKKITKNLWFHLTFKTATLQDNIFTKKATDINVTIIYFLFVPILVPNAQTQVMFNESIFNNYTITFDSWYTERKISNDGRKLQVDMGSAQHFNSPKYLIGAFQTKNKIEVPNKADNIAVFDTNHVKKTC